MNTENWNELENYLIKQYEVYEDKNYLTDPSEIEEYFKDNGYDYFDCGQGYSQDEADIIVYIANKFYLVSMEAVIGSQRQDRGDRLYFVEDIENVTYEEISKPERRVEYIDVKIHEDDIERALALLELEGVQLKDW